MSGPPVSQRCSDGQPLSWLTLELYHLGDLAGAAAGRVKLHLERCPGCRSCLELIVTDRPVLKPLPPVARRPRRFWRSRRVQGAGLAVLAAAAALLLVLLPRDRGQLGFPPSRIAFKGGDLALSLVRARGEEVLHDPTDFAPGDRFKALVTRPPQPRPLHGELVVYQDGTASFPLREQRPLPAGNREPLPGAFTLSRRSPAVICLVVGEKPLDRDRLRGRSAVEPDHDAVCVKLLPAALD